MPYTDFHYTPTGTGVISGKEVLEQTEDAINDLGGQISGDVQTAIDTANNALNVANTASTDAQNAVNTANTAYTTATNAQNTANAAQNTASNALTAAQNAQNDVNALGNRVTTAENNITQNTTDISGLTTRMGTAEGNITTLQNDVVTAQGTATSAQNTATMARQQSYVLRYSSTAITDNSTIAYSTLDNTDNIKADDKIIDVDGKIFSVVSVDSDNSTVTVGSALIDLALDANVVHTSGNETVGGQKTFSDNISIYNSDNSVNTPVLNIKTSKYVKGDTTNTDTMRINFLDSNGNNVASVYANKNVGGSQYLTFQVYTTDNNNANISSTINYLLTKNGDRYFTPYEDGLINLGETNRKWKTVYATNYYYGSNNVEFSTKFVTTDTNQTISGEKIFNNGARIYKSNSSENTPSFVLRTSKVSRGSTTDGGDSQSVMFNDRGDLLLAGVRCTKVSNGTTQLRNIVNTTDTSDNIITCETQLNIAKNGDKSFVPSEDAQINLGSSSYRWKTFNGLTPSSLSLPSGNANDVIDISGYLVYLDGTANTYTAPANGWIAITMSGCSGIQAYINGLWGNQVVRPSVGGVRFLMPVVKNLTVNILIFGGAIDNARFILCQGNV